MQLGEKENDENGGQYAAMLGVRRTLLHAFESKELNSLQNFHKAELEASAACGNTERLRAGNAVRPLKRRKLQNVTEMGTSPSLNSEGAVQYAKSGVM